MSGDSNKESKSIGRNIFAERSGSGPAKKPEEAPKKKPAKEKSEEKSPKSIGRNIFSEAPKKTSEAPAVNSDLKIIEKPTQDLMGSKSKSKASLKKSSINAIHITNEHIVFAQTTYDGMKYKLTNLQIVPIELPAITEDNVFKNKEEPEVILENLKCEAIDKVFSRAGVSKTDPNIVTSMNGSNMIVKQLYIQNTPDEEIEAEIPKLVKTPFEKLSTYDYITLNSDGLNHHILASVVEGKLFFDTQNFLNKNQLECNILDIDKMAIVNLYHESVKPMQGTISCIVDISYDYSNIIIVPNGNEELYIRNIEFNYNKFKKMLQSNRDISSAETEEMIKTRNFYDYITKAFEMETTENLNQHYPVKNFVRLQLLRELQKTFQYYSKQNHNRIPTKIYITGKALEIGKFAEFINKNTDIPCEPLDVTGFFSGDINVTDYAKEKQSEAYVAIGLALRYE